MQMLLLEDDEVVARGIVRLAAVLHYRVTHARTVAEAKMAFLAQPFEVVLVDLGLADGETGLDFLAWVREQAPHVTRVLTSGAQIGRETGSDPLAHLILPKPFGRVELLRLLQSVTPASVS